MARNFVAALMCLFVVFIGFNSCEKSEGIELSDSDYLIFGTYYGMCAGDCVTFFGLEENKLSKSTRTEYPPIYASDGFYNGKFVAMSQEKYEIAKDLPDAFPKDLLKESNVFLGCPDCADGGGIYLEYNVDGIRKYWQIDATKHGVAEKYHAFIDEVLEKISLLRDED